jgi:high-affinity iron transporter
VPDTVIPYFLYSLGIIVREGLEAMLVVVALAAGTRNFGGRDRSRDVYRGALIAVAVSIGLAWAVNHIITDNASDTLEGVFQFLAAATLFYVSSWLTAKSQADRWLKFISEKVERAENSAVPGFALGLAAFLAVVREGGETIVFFKALTAGTTAPIELHAILVGLIAGVVLLAMVFWILTRASYRIPVGSFFWATSILLYALAVVFVGQGVASWQESGILGATFIEHLPQIPMLGFFPTVQSIGAQAALIMLALASFFAPRRSPERKVNVPAEQPQSAPRPT